ncbi:MAG: beta-N-acetylhexosaminidase [Alphaproteobacteria bacterium]
MPSKNKNIKAIVFGCSGPRLTEEERRFFQKTQPLGFIIFARNIENPAQVKQLITDLNATQERELVPILIDQEGGRVARLKPPHWDSYPAAATLAALPDKEAEEATYLTARLIADELTDLGFTMDCAPVLDLLFDGADSVIGDRSFGTDPERVSILGNKACEGFLDGGISPILKHIAGHGRATADSHKALPVVDTDLATLHQTDFVPFKNLKDYSYAMTAHVVYSTVDKETPLSTSRETLQRIVRQEIGFNGVLFSDALRMEALTGSVAERAKAVLDAGCDIALHCTGDLTEMQEIAAIIPPLPKTTIEKILSAEQKRKATAKPFNRKTAREALEALVKAAHCDTKKLDPTEHLLS